MNISDILSTSLGGITIGEVFTALVTLVICLLVVRLLLKMTTRLLARSHHLGQRVKKYIVSGLELVL